MSRIGRKTIIIPEGVDVKMNGMLCVVKGHLGELSVHIDSGLELKIQDKQLSLTRSNDDVQTKSLHGLYRSIVNNMVLGVSLGFKISQVLVGIGYRVEVKQNILEFALGYSHPIHMVLPPEIKASVEHKKGSDPILTLESIDKQLLGQVASKIRTLRKPEPYKGKGIRFLNEQVRRKAGKTSKK